MAFPKGKRQREPGLRPLCAEVFVGGDYSDEERLFVAAVAAWQKRTGRKFPAATDYLTVLKGMGYVLRAELDAVILQCAGRLADASEVLGRLAEKKEKRRL